MGGDDDIVIDIPSIDELTANPKRYQSPEQRAASPPASRPPERRKDAKPPPPAPPEAAGDPTAGPESFAEGDGYKAYGWGGNKAHASLRLIFKDGTEKGMVYGHLDSHPQSGSEFIPSIPGRKGNAIRLRICGQGCVFTVIILGLFLRRVWELIMDHQTPWIHEMPSDAVVLRHGDPVIWSIGFADLLDKAEGKRADE